MTSDMEKRARELLDDLFPESMGGVLLKPPDMRVVTLATALEQAYRKGQKNPRGCNHAECEAFHLGADVMPSIYDCEGPCGFSKAKAEGRTEEREKWMKTKST